MRQLIHYRPYVIGNGVANISGILTTYRILSIPDINHEIWNLGLNNTTEIPFSNMFKNRKQKKSWKTWPIPWNTISCITMVRKDLYGPQTVYRIAYQFSMPLLYIPIYIFCWQVVIFLLYWLFSLKWIVQLMGKVEREIRCTSSNIESNFFLLVLILKTRTKVRSYEITFEG